VKGDTCRIQKNEYSSEMIGPELMSCQSVLQMLLGCLPRAGKQPNYEIHLDDVRNLQIRMDTQAHLCSSTPHRDHMKGQ
jgi:hypothetical protein